MDAAINISIPESLLAEIQNAAKAEHRSVDEVLTDAVKRYVEERSWTKLLDYGAERAKALGIKESDVDRLIAESGLSSAAISLTDSDQRHARYQRLYQSAAFRWPGDRNHRPRAGREHPDRHFGRDTDRDDPRAPRQVPVGWLCAPGRAGKLLAAGNYVVPTETLHVIKEDPDDDRILECAAAAKSDFIVSEDKDLLRLGQFGHAPIVSVRDFHQSRDRAT